MRVLNPEIGAFASAGLLNIPYSPAIQPAAPVAFTTPHLPLTMDTAVIVPTLNERENIGALIESIERAAPDLHVVIVDDDSPDGTADVVLNLIEQQKARGRHKVHLVPRESKKSYAAAVQDGMRYALEHGARLVLQMDADFSHDPKYLPQLLKLGEECDLVIGSRYVRGGGTRNWGWDRKLLSGGANRLARLLLGLRTHDCTGGYRCWKRELIEKSGVLNVHVEGYAFLFLTLDRCRTVGAHIGEVPIVFVDRQFGQSKMSRRIVLEAGRVLLRLWWKRNFAHNR